MHPILFELGPVTVRAYGVVVATAFFVSFLLLYAEARKKNFYATKILDLEFLMLVSGIIGARALHVLVNLDFYGSHLPDIFLIWKGGFAFYGGLISAALAAWVFILKKKMPLYETADFIAPYAALGHSIGRLGCFLNGCCFGRPVATPFLGVMFPGDSIYRYPAQTYASLALLCIFIILKLVQEKPHLSGSVFGLYIALYSVQRFFIDFLRGDNPTYAAGLTISQLISIALFTIAVLFLLWLRKRNIWKS